MSPAPAKKATAKKTTPARRGGAKKATASAREKFEDSFAKSMGVTPKTKPKRPKIVTTGAMALDYALAVGGVPEGRVIEMWGPEHAGKTTTAIILAVQFQHAHPDRMIAWVDMEQTFDEDWAEALGLDMSRVYFYVPMTAEDVSDAVKRFVYSDICSLVVLDSVGGMISRIETEKEADEETVGKVPKIVTRMVKTAAPKAATNGTTLCVINQVRANIGGYGPDEDTGGGWALKHVTTMKLQVRKVGGAGTSREYKRPHDEKPIPVGHKIAVRVQKNKMGPYGQVAEIWLHNVPTPTFGPVGFDNVGDTFGFAKRFNLLGPKAKSGYYLFGTDEVRGEPAALDYLRLRPDLVEDLRKQVLATRADVVNEDIDESPPEEADDALGMADMVDA